MFCKKKDIKPARFDVLFGGYAAERCRHRRRKKHAERAVPAGTNFLLGRAKSCQWQVFVRRRPPKQGELRTDVSKATMFQGDRGLRPSGLPGTIQISARFVAVVKVTGVHQVTGCAGNCKLSGYRRLGFESVRKGSRRADARLRSFENGLFCCKLTVGFRR